ncbi:MAG: class I SAM-dependent methyltransferase [Cyanobacteria bacterium J06623_7]
MAQSNYIFSQTQFQSELTRLQRLEKVYDSISQQQIIATGITTGWQCLEIGAGAGSVMRWMSEIVGAAGQVTAIDLDTRFIKNTQLANVETIEADIHQIKLDKLFDLIHVRHVLIHQADTSLLTRIWKLLKPGGWLVIEESDFSSTKFVAGTPAQQQAIAKVNQAICQMFANQGNDYAIGIKLPSLLQKVGFQNLQIINDVPIVAGNSDIAILMNLSTRQLAEKYLATGKVIQADLETYCQCTEDTSAWAIYLATVSEIARKPVL